MRLHQLFEHSKTTNLEERTTGELLKAKLGKWWNDDEYKDAIAWIERTGKSPAQAARMFPGTDARELADILDNKVDQRDTIVGPEFAPDASVEAGYLESSDEDAPEESFDPTSEPTDSEEKFENAMAAYDAHGEEGLAKALGMSLDEFDQELNEYGMMHGLHADDDRDTIIHGMVEQMIDDAEAMSDMRRMSGLEELNNLRKRAGLEVKEVSEDSNEFENNLAMEFVELPLASMSKEEIEDQMSEIFKTIYHMGREDEPETDAGVAMEELAHAVDDNGGYHNDDWRYPLEAEEISDEDVQAIIRHQQTVKDVLSLEGDSQNEEATEGFVQVGIGALNKGAKKPVDAEYEARRKAAREKGSGNHPWKAPVIDTRPVKKESVDEGEKVETAKGNIYTWAEANREYSMYGKFTYEGGEFTMYYDPQMGQFDNREPIEGDPKAQQVIDSLPDEYFANDEKESVISGIIDMILENAATQTEELNDLRRRAGLEVKDL